MKCEYIHKSKGRNEGLILFFGGWGCSPELFVEYVPERGYDFMLCYDYRNLDFEHTFFNNYRKIKVFAWSMGVWVATQVLGNQYMMKSNKNFGEKAENSMTELNINGTDEENITKILDIEQCIAIGGTPFPIDNHRGIPVKVFDGTVEKMSLPVLYKFRRRMCGAQTEHFERHLPHRTFEDLKEELATLGNMVRETEFFENERNIWTEAIVGENDVIFPAVNQLRAWKELGVKVSVVPSCHYDNHLFAKLIAGEMDFKN